MRREDDKTKHSQPLMDSRLSAAGERLRELKKFQDFFRFAPYGMAIIDPSGGILFLNKTAQAILQIDHKGAQLRRFVDLIHPEDRPEFIVAQQTNNQDSTTLPCDYRLFNPTSKDDPILISASISPPLAEHGARVVSLRDVTEERRLSAELNDTKDFLEQLVNNSLIGIVVADACENIVLLNKGAQNVLGYDETDCKGEGLTLRVIFPLPQSEPCPLDLMRSPKRGKERVFAPKRMDLRGKAGDIIPVMLGVTIIRHAENGDMVMLTFTDLRDRIRMEEELRSNLVEQERLAAITELAGTTAHELNQPLTVISAWAEALENGQLSGHSANQAIGAITKETDRMAAIVKKIGGITSYQNKHYVGRATIVDLERAASVKSDKGD